jgi:hypothetical protein
MVKRGLDDGNDAIAWALAMSNEKDGDDPARRTKCINGSRPDENR